MTTSDLDIRGLTCPMTVIKVLQKVRTLEDYDKMVVITDAETATNSIPKEMHKKGLGCSVQNISPGEWKIEIMKE